jgi:hypothetical protein
MDVKKDINNCIRFIKKYILTDKFNIHKINIDTKSLYYKIEVSYSNKNEKSPTLFSEYILSKNDNTILHCFSNDIKINDYSKDDVEEETYNSRNIIKIFYDKDRWINISNIDDISNHAKNMFNNTNDFYEILNKEFYYTYNFKNSKIKFLSKGIKNSVNQYYDENVKNIILDNEKYIFVKKSNKKEEYCKYELKCINPICNFNHPNGYDLYLAYKKYIIEEKNKNFKFKSINCKNDDDTCAKHRYNKCIFLHKDDPIEK